VHLTGFTLCSLTCLGISTHDVLLGIASLQEWECTAPRL
jgi:hypothetical protein